MLIPTLTNFILETSGLRWSNFYTYNLKKYLKLLNHFMISMWLSFQIFDFCIEENCIYCNIFLALQCAISSVGTVKMIWVWYLVNLSLVTFSYQSIGIESPAFRIGCLICLKPSTES